MVYHLGMEGLVLSQQLLHLGFQNLLGKGKLVQSTLWCPKLLDLRAPWGAWTLYQALFNEWGCPGKLPYHNMGNHIWGHSGIKKLTWLMMGKQNLGTNQIRVSGQSEWSAKAGQVNQKGRVDRSKVTNELSQVAGRSNWERSLGASQKEQS